MPRPSREQLLELLEQHGTAQAVADALGGRTHRTTVERWKARYGIRRSGHVVVDPQSGAPAA